jgi:esterase/lipase superfamily enzyme
MTLWFSNLIPGQIRDGVFRFLWVTGGVVILVACAGPPVVVTLPNANPGRASETVLVAAHRTAITDATDTIRQTDLIFSAYDIRIPPARNFGDVETVRNPARAIDLTSEFIATRADILPDETAFIHNLQHALADVPVANRRVVLFIHGYNTPFATGLFRTAQIRYDFNLPAQAVHFSWPSGSRVADYVYDRDSVLFARDGLERTLGLIAAQGIPIHIVAHSMGSHLTMETLRQISIGRNATTLAAIESVVLIAPDLDVDLFRNQIERIDMNASQFSIFTSNRDRALLVSSRLTRQSERLGSLENIAALEQLGLSVIDVSDFDNNSGDLLGHITALTSPDLIGAFFNALGLRPNDRARIQR